jgi:hypothetical protein
LPRVAILRTEVGHFWTIRVGHFKMISTNCDV